ncbi:protein kinase C-binding protein 1 isoform X2 [Ixodes scapularis]|nr:protein kinase C-binding protein 1 isoform X2 [Ixodes scapularis]
MNSEDQSRIKGKKKAAPSTGTPDAKKVKLAKGVDRFCWICHREPASLWCNTCPRSYHASCVNLKVKSLNEWVCPECVRVMSAENVDTRPSSLSLISVDEFCSLLQYALQRLKQHTHEAFLKPVCTKTYPNYTDYVSHPFDLSILEKNVRWKHYGCTESFLSDARWIYHNCIIFNGYNHKLSMSAKVLMKVCKQEMEEIEVCPDCYKNANTHDSWFTEPCRRPHLLVWAKLKGFPFWPAKAMRVQDSNIDARFFGAHDRAWVPMNQCFLLSKESPTEIKNRKKGLQNAVEELEIYIQKYKEKYGEYSYSVIRTPVTLQDFNNTPTAEKKTFGGLCSSPTTSDDKELNSALSTLVVKKRVPSETPSPTNNASQDGSEGTQSTSANLDDESLPCSPAKDSPMPAKRVKEEKATPVPDGTPQGIFEVSAELPGELQMRVSQQDMEDLPKKVNRNVESLVSALKKIERSISSDTNHAEAPRKKEGRDEAAARGKTTAETKDARRRGSPPACDVTSTTTEPGEAPPSFAPATRAADDFREKLKKTILSIKEKVGGAAPVAAEDPTEDEEEVEDEEEEEEDEEEAGESEGEKAEAEEKRSEEVVAAKETAVAEVRESPRPAGEVSEATESTGVAQEETSRESTGSQGSRVAGLAKMKFTTKRSLSSALLASALQPPSSDGSLLPTKDNSTNNFLDASAKDSVESVRQECKEEMDEYHHILALTLKEMRICLDLEFKKATAATIEKQAAEVAKAVAETKRKQWCANCWKEAVFFCCWNTSYCDYPCQQAHWPKHMANCTQTSVSQQVQATGVSLINNGSLAEVALPDEAPLGAVNPSSLGLPASSPAEILERLCVSVEEKENKTQPSVSSSSQLISIQSKVSPSQPSLLRLQRADNASPAVAATTMKAVSSFGAILPPGLTLTTITPSKP